VGLAGKRGRETIWEVDPSGVAYVAYTYMYDENELAYAMMGRFDDTTSTFSGIPLLRSLRPLMMNSMPWRPDWEGFPKRMVIHLPMSPGEEATYAALSEFASNNATLLTNWYYPYIGA